MDSLTTVRRLKERGVEVFFQKENIYTLDSKGELLITIMSSLAQEESRSISENVTWGQRKRFADGKVSMPYKQFLGYPGIDIYCPVITFDPIFVNNEDRNSPFRQLQSASPKHLGNTSVWVYPSW